MSGLWATGERSRCLPGRGLGGQRPGRWRQSFLPIASGRSESCTCRCRAGGSVGGGCLGVDVCRVCAARVCFTRSRRQRATRTLILPLATPGSRRLIGSTRCLLLHEDPADNVAARRPRRHRESRLPYSTRADVSVTARQLSRLTARFLSCRRRYTVCVLHSRPSVL